MKQYFHYNIIKYVYTTIQKFGLSMFLVFFYSAKVIKLIKNDRKNIYFN